MKKNILIISYVFPPYPGIGGRRWAKFAKYLHRAGHNVYVIAAQNPFENISTFIKDIQEIPQENIIYLPSKYPSVLLQYPKKFFDKLQYHFWIKTLPFFTKGNFYDRSMFWKWQLYQTIQKIIQNKQISSIIVSGPPFNMAYEVTLLKREFPDIQIIVDYRDEWTFNKVHGFGIISKKRQEVEFQKEQYVCENADIIMSCDEIILEYLINRYNVKKYFHLPHGFDKDDFKYLEVDFINHQPKNDNRIIISYFGNIQPNTEMFFNELCRTLDIIRDNNISLYDKLLFSYYLMSPFHYEDIISLHKSKFIFNYNISSSDVFSNLSSSDFIVVILSKRAKDYFTSKYPEIFYLKKPILLYSEKGRVSEFIEKHKIGVHLPQENFYDAFVNAITNPSQFSYQDLDVEQWDFENLTQELVSILK
ncbi:MAG: hypothetical protein OHK0036_01180 [Bacteroidia bacterium]